MGMTTAGKVVATSVTTFLALAAGYGFAKFKFRISGFFYFFFIMGLLITVHSVLVPLFIMETKLNIDNTRLGVLLPYIAFGLPFLIYLSTSYIRCIPDSLEEAAEDARLSAYHLVAFETERIAHRGMIVSSGRVIGWKGRHFYTLDFTSYRKPGFYRLKIPLAAGALVSEPFEIGANVLQEKTIPAILSYFRCQRCSGQTDRADRSIPFTGSRTDRVDVHGGWYDATGDTSKYLSHLSYANYLNPQQTPLVVWSLLASREAPEQRQGNESLCRRMEEEASYGTDFLIAHARLRRILLYHCVRPVEQGYQPAQYLRVSRSGGN